MHHLHFQLNLKIYQVALLSAEMTLLHHHNEWAHKMNIEAELRCLVLNQRLLLMELFNPIIVLQYDLIKLIHTVDIETINNLGPCYVP